MYDRGYHYVVLERRLLPFSNAGCLITVVEGRDEAFDEVRRRVEAAQGDGWRAFDSWEAGTMPRDETGKVYPIASALLRRPGPPPEYLQIHAMRVPHGAELAAV